MLGTNMSRHCTLKNSHGTPLKKWVSQKVSQNLQGAFLGSTIVFWGGSLLKCLQIHHYLISYFITKQYPKSPKNIQHVEPSCQDVIVIMNNSHFKNGRSLSLSVPGFSHQQFSVEIHGSYYKYKGKERKRPRIWLKKCISSNAKGKRTRETTHYTNITTSQVALHHYTVLKLQEPSIVSILKPTPSEYDPSEYDRLNFTNTPDSLACGCGRPMKTTTHHPPPAPKHNF